ncbi:MAG: bifunctional proline dehydrogenase/L-glutamate gamma-semialdehyde dehydrogenase PutA [Hyphomonadaceae bacterium]|nr:bifunctional proline dehydrogenase/L-glutamate gamma-semialdehyde dehydrogenase PutA [Hyphomonadaceae bacterium]
MTTDMPIHWNILDTHKYADEDAVAIPALLAAPLPDAALRASILQEGRAIVRKARAAGRKRGVVESFLEEFSLSTQEGLALMCLAEALLRTPDAETVDRLIAEKIGVGEWGGHLGGSDDWLVNASTLGLMLTGRLVDLGGLAGKGAAAFTGRMVSRMSEPVVRAAVAQAMRIMGEQFVLGRTVKSALKRGAGFVRRGDASHFSVDMLGEGARTAADAARYLKAYQACIADIASAVGDGAPEDKSGVSVKLSALHPRYDIRQKDRLAVELYPVLLGLCQQAKAANINLCLDAEEADRLVLSLELLEQLARAPELEGWTGLGLAVQAYQKRAPAVIDAVAGLARDTGRRLMVRLVKGAYWDTEIKRAQASGRPDFPVWTTRAATDTCYLVCAGKMIAAVPHLYPQFASHNAHTVAAVRQMAEKARVRVEFQRLHGMGEPLYAALDTKVAVRVYAPVGQHEDLLPYLVRRLLENGANTSFVHTFLDEDVPVEQVVTDPIGTLTLTPRRHARIAAPPQLFGIARANAAGLDLSMAADRTLVAEALARLDGKPIQAAPLIGGKPCKGASLPITRPSDRGLAVGSVIEADVTVVAEAAKRAAKAQPRWDRLGGPGRAAILRKAADAMEQALPDLIALLAREAGRTLQDGIDEVREAVDFLRYYAADADRLFAAPEALPGPVGETNRLTLGGRGVFGAIAPWNFPLAIFTGQVAAALAAGNAVLAKPAPQTPLIGFEAVRILHAAGVPGDVLAFLPGGAEVGTAICAAPDVTGIAFTGSTATARAINRTLAAKDGPIATLIAETGGLNAMFVDTSALIEQVVDDVIVSAFGSAGQRCSALRILYAPHDTADMLIEKLTGALAEVRSGDPADPATDTGPLIDAAAKARIEAHLETITAQGARIIARQTLPDVAAAGDYFAATIVEIPSIDLITQEPFGPVLHVLRYDPADIATAGAALAAEGYGLTLGIHTRLDRFVGEVTEAVPAGNVYVNRSMIGAVVGVQPFGGRGLSGTGPKAGGPYYVARFATETVISENIAAKGGDPGLFSL